MKEVAHFVRCIPFRRSQEYFSADSSVSQVWAPPDFLLSLRRGSIEEHALLLASMFRGVKQDIDNTDCFGRAKKKPRTKKSDDAAEDTMSNRVFLCLGRAMRSSSAS